MSLELFISKGLSAALMLIFFGMVVLFLRWLYGPKGRFRDPKWDEWNREARREEAQKQEEREESALRESFARYARSFLGEDAGRDARVRLKMEHSLRVLEHARRLAAAEPAFAEEETARALRLAALFHDVGRFEQLRRYNTFADAASCNHGVLGAKVIRAQGFLEKETRSLRSLALAAVAAHNRPSVPAAASGAFRAVLTGLRDADKLDILRTMRTCLDPEAEPDEVVRLSLREEPRSYSPALLEALEQGRVGRYRDMRYVNDFRLLLCTWLFDIAYGTTLESIRRDGHYEVILDGLKSLPDVREKATAVVAERLAF